MMGERSRTMRAVCADIVGGMAFTDSGFPVMEREDVSPSSMVQFNRALTSRPMGGDMVAFFIDDYQFERVWSSPARYVPLLERFGAACSPDFSLYTSYPIEVQRWNHYRSMLMGAYWQINGICVVPTLQWSDERSFSFCFDGVPRGGTVAVSAIGCNRSREASALWREGMDRAMDEVMPSRVLMYGAHPEFDFGGVEVVSYDNEVIGRLHHGR